MTAKRLEGPRGDRVYRPSLARRLIGPVNRLFGSPFGLSRATLYEADTSDDLPDYRTSLAVEVEIATGEDLVEINAITPNSALEELRDRVRDGETCIVARTEGRVRGFVWLKKENHWDNDLHATVIVADDRCLGYGAHTIESARGQGIRQRLHIEERRQCRALGREKLLFWLVEEQAHRALRKWHELGLRQTAVARITTYRLFWMIRFSQTRRLRRAP